jgi:hypothetical protein
MATKDLPHGIVGHAFARALLTGDFDKAHDLLGVELKLEYPVSHLKKKLEQMIGRADEPTDLPEIEVLDNGELGHLELDTEGWAYVAVWSEAVTVTVKPFGQEYLITELIWGRP